MIGFSSVASNVIAPSNTKTGIAENTHPFPREQVKTIYKILIFCISGFPLQPFAKPLKPFFDIDHFSDQSAQRDTEDDHHCLPAHQCAISIFITPAVLIAVPNPAILYTSYPFLSFAAPSKVLRIGYTSFYLFILLKTTDNCRKNDWGGYGSHFCRYVPVPPVHPSPPSHQNRNKYI